jgi:aryl-alcohol dehydrogenase-like predicted oxidoreductase
MEYRRLGRSGLKVSALSLGSWLTFGKQISDDVAEELMICAYDNGINFFDNAEIYARGKSEIVMGNILKKLEWRRDTYLVSSKVFWGGDKPNQTGLSRKHVFEACHAALKRFQLDYLDLYFCHRPDPETPIEETVWVMNDLIRQGKILNLRMERPGNYRSLRHCAPRTSHSAYDGTTTVQHVSPLSLRTRIQTRFRRAWLWFYHLVASRIGCAFG